MTGRAASLTVELQGGLANQLFQWATFTSAWDPARGCLLWDERLVTRPGRRGNELLRVGLISGENVIHQSRVDRLRWRAIERMPYPLPDYAASKLRTSPPRPDCRILREGELALASQNDHWWARGYFQEPSAFGFARSTIRERLRRALERLVPEETWRLDQPYAAVHVRRGDYVAVQQITDRLGVCTLDYFVAAICDLDRELPVKLVSDDPHWCREVMAPAAGRDVDVIESGSDISDLLVLMGASALVLSNSTFSWWGAFASAASRVTAPSLWFDAPDAGGDQLPDIADVLRDKVTGRLAVSAG